MQQQNVASVCGQTLQSTQTQTQSGPSEPQSLYALCRVFFLMPCVSQVSFIIFLVMVTTYLSFRRA